MTATCKRFRSIVMEIVRSVQLFISVAPFYLYVKPLVPPDTFRYLAPGCGNEGSYGIVKLQS